MGFIYGLGIKGFVRVVVIIFFCILKFKLVEELSRGWGEVGGNRRVFCFYLFSIDLGFFIFCRRRGFYSKGFSVF